MAITPYQEKKYTQSEAVTQAQQALKQQQENKPGEYSSRYQAGLEELADQIRSRPKFQYDVNADALYQQAAQSYLSQGRQAMMDTVGQAAALTGGYGNSYAQTAGQQVYNQHLTGLAELVPQYRQMALQQYRMEGDDLLDRYSLLLQQEESDYARYQDNLSRYYAQLDRLQGIYDSERSYDYSRYADDRDFGYGKYMDDLNYQYQLGRDKLADDRYLEQWLYQQERDRIQDQQWQKEFDENQRRYDQEWAWQQAQAAAAAAKAGSGGRKSGGVKSAYQELEARLAEGDYSSAEMLREIRTSSLTENQQDKLVTKYQKPKQTEEVKEASEKRKNRDNSAYWSSR